MPSRLRLTNPPRRTADGLTPEVLRKHAYEDEATLALSNRAVDYYIALLAEAGRRGPGQIDPTKLFGYGPADIQLLTRKLVDAGLVEVAR